MPKLTPIVTNVFLILFIFFANTSAFGQINTEVSPVPDWITRTEANPQFDRSNSDHEGGIYYLLVDTQMKLDAEKEGHFFYHYANLIANPKGLESNSQINISFDPLYEKILLHEVKILRDGQVIDKTKSSKMQVIQREDQLEQLIYNGLHTLNIILDDVRVGDTLEYSFSLIGENPVYKGYFSSSHSLEWQVPVDQVYVRLIWNKERPLYSKILNSPLSINQQTTQWGKEYSIHLNQIDRKSVEIGVPVSYEPWAKLYFNELADWSSVAKWGLSLYDGVFVSDAAMNAFAAEIKAKTNNQAEQISYALRFVQNEIRYLGIELGSNSHIPSPAYETFNRRYGDCKDKTVLLITLLKQLGIDAAPVLVDTDRRAQIAAQPASPKAFNHVITQVMLDGKPIYLDPTRNYQSGDLTRIFLPNYGAGLVLRANTTNLTLMPAASDNSVVEVHEKFIIGATPDEPVYSTTLTRFTGFHAEQQRRYLDETGIKNFQDDFLSFFQQYYSGSEIHKEIELSDNDQTNEFTSIERYQINHLWSANTETQGRFDTSFYSNILNSYIEYQDVRTRKDPLSIRHPMNVSQTLEIEFPDNNWAFDEEQFSKNTDFFDFSYSARFDKDSRILTLAYAYESKVKEVSPADYPAYFDALDAIANYSSYNIYWTPAGAGSNTSESDTTFTAMHFIFIYIGCQLIIFLLWRFDKKKHPDPEGAAYYPVAIPKLIAMWVMTFGLYGAYWFYRNFKYIKQNENKPSMPVARGIFSYFWYFPLWKNLKLDSLNRYGENHLPPSVIAILLAILYLCSALAINAEYLTIPALILSSLLVLPMANYILFINKGQPAVKHFSRWTIHHYLLIIVSLPICLLTFSAQVGLTPNEAVVEGHQLLDYDTRQFRKKGILRADEKIVFFYSNAVLSNQHDGNGFTEQSVFSFWKDDFGQFNLEKANYSDIKDIYVNFSEEPFGHTTVTITRHNGTEFMLLVSNTKKKDLEFVTELKRLWQENKSPRTYF